MAKFTDDRELFLKYKETGSNEYRNAIVEKYLYLVDLIIRKYLNKGIEYDDLYQVASMALVLAAERYDPDRGFEFSSYATPTIIGEIKKYFRDKGWAVRVPRRLKELSLQIPKAKEVLYDRLQRNPKICEIAEYLGQTEEEILEAMESGQAYSTYSLQQSFDNSADGEADAFLEKYTGREDSRFDTFENMDFILKTLENLSDQEKYVFKMRFIEGKTQQELAKEMGVSQMTISRIEKKLRNKFKEEYNK